MKLRIKGESLRLRLTQSEVRTLAEQGSVEDRICFGNEARLVYRLTRDPAVKAISADYWNGIVDVRLPDTSARRWCKSNDVTLAGEVALKDAMTADVTLRVVVEKDYACLTVREGEDESDNFPNPNQSC